MTDTANHPYNETDEDVEGHAARTLFRLPTIVTQSDEDEDDVEGHGWHVHHHKH